MKFLNKYCSFDEERWMDGEKIVAAELSFQKISSSAGSSSFF
jgi:hypothetical protein